MHTKSFPIILQAPFAGLVALNQPPSGIPLHLTLSRSIAPDDDTYTNSTEDSDYVPSSSWWLELEKCEKIWCLELGQEGWECWGS